MSAIAIQGAVVNVPAPSADRAKFVKNRIKAIQRNFAQDIVEMGQLLREYMVNQYYKSDGYSSFNEAIDKQHETGSLEFKASQARNLIRIAEMIDEQGIDPKELQGISISKLREIATLPKEKAKALLPEAKNMSVADIQKEARVERAKAKGHDVDPLNPWTFMFTDSQKEMLKEAINHARVVHGFDETTNDAAVLESIVADWRSGAPNEGNMPTFRGDPGVDAGVPGDSVDAQRFECLGCDQMTATSEGALCQQCLSKI